MKQSSIWTIALTVVLTLGTAPALPAGAQHAAAIAPGSAHGSGPVDYSRPNATTGSVVETMDAGSYTYVQVDDGSKKIWAAAPRFTVSVGDKVVVPPGGPMPNFESKTLGRKFDVVYFVGAVKVLNKATESEQLSTAHGSARIAAPAVDLDLTNIEKAEGGYTVAELFSEKASLAGKEVAVRGRVAKFTANVMKKNWVHLRDGSGDQGTNDITVTTTDKAAVGDLVLVRGTLAVEKHFGFGYKYDVLIEDAVVTAK